ncbi:molybdopterin-dependent oxidoreductase [Baekduia sp. Peel2402]|uniref:molybdopterin-dependent oxidoreductase n=1 Tax=Baekduia sp. Peel2402 TaxID=3458296 RepID=UPI00403EDF59
MSDEQVPDGRPIGRRAFFGVVGVGITGLLWGDQVARLVAKSTTVLPAPVRSAIPLGEGWRIYSVNPPFPHFHPATWRLEIDGLVERPQRFTLDDLQALPAAQQVSDFHCVTGWSVNDVRWRGVRFDDLLASAGLLPNATALSFVSSEKPYVDTLTLEQIRAAPDAMLALEMDGKPLTREHGAPARVVMPQMYGYKGVKWVQRITVTDTVKDGYWEQRGYDRDAYVGRSNGL